MFKSKIFYRLILFLAFVVLARPIFGEEKFMTNKKDQAAINLIVQMCSNIEKEIKNKKMVTKTKDECPEGGGEVRSQESVFIDKKGRIKKLMGEGGDGDMVASTSFYYDDKGRLRLIVYSSNSVYGRQEEQKIFLDENRNVIQVNWKNSTVNKEGKISKSDEGVSETPINTPWYIWDAKKEFYKKRNCDEEDKKDE